MHKPFFMKDARIRLALVGGVIMCIFLGVVVRLLWVQIISGTELGKKATTQITGHLKKTAPRGRILDCNGEELAVSIMANTLIANPKEMVINPKGKKDQAVPRDVKREAAKLLAPALQISEDELYKDFSREGEYVRIKRMLEPKASDAVAQIIKDNKLPGLYFEQESKRYYTKKSMAAQVLGFVGEDDSGLSGLELALDGILKGALFYQEEKVDALGRPVAESSLMDKRPPKVSSVYLTIDSKMQFVVEDALDDAMKRTNAAGAAVIIMDPETGAILAMGSRPTFDPNNYGKFAQETWLNRGISIIYEPGSVFKPIMGCAGMSEGIVSPDTPIQDNGSIQVADRTIRNWDGSGMGAIHFQDVIKYSINTGMVQLGLKLGADREIAYAKKFGFGKETGIELPGEEDGISIIPRRWCCLMWLPWLSDRA
jgi:cell division protein FtsI (penicillin-binding protein 3)/stage V sporulation protein D (sporulation-specific penicillin-binding protein)